MVQYESPDRSSHECQYRRIRSSAEKTGAIGPGLPQRQNQPARLQPRTEEIERAAGLFEPGRAYENVIS